MSLPASGQAGTVWAYGLVAVALGLSAALAVIVPAARAARLDPVRAMRRD